MLGLIRINVGTRHQTIVSTKNLNKLIWDVLEMSSRILNSPDPDQTAHKEQSDFGRDCLPELLDCLILLGCTCIIILRFHDYCIILLVLKDPNSR